ncbi:TrmH family RNA methyltransferase [Nitrosospira sp. Nsp2]|uniref:TrmH family RNA methyltransferase n=1 Tax=Nitrosospira sp. Nsp2 TaxID=136548 RepID=UPI000D30A49D|nr:RNA methyltransferase [Nitrosospira sp. Nsp2]PTR17285.1 TrmH family RNA methyltransferase [Nitrosospira sp. Nsp2]
MKLISSRDNAFSKQLVKLAGSAHQRRATGLTLLDGIHLIHAYRLALGRPKNLIVSESSYRNKEIKQLLAEQDEEEASVIVLSDALFRAVSPVKTPTGVIALVDIPAQGLLPEREEDSFWVLLEAIQDPGNLGSILRSAAAAGASNIYLSDGCADVWSPKTLRAAMGAHFLVRIHEQSDLASVARTFSGKVIATSLRAKNSLYRTCLTGPVAFVFGNEGMGLSDALLQAASDQIVIPMRGCTESLNAAAAAAVCFFERVRQMSEAPTDTTGHNGRQDG